MTANKTIAIIGGGASGVMVLNYLIEGFAGRGVSEVCIYLIEKDKEIGPGLAYSTPVDSHILNMRVDTMSAIVDDPDHFSRWLVNRSNSSVAEKYDSESYPPRKIYAEYIKDLFAGALRKANNAGIIVECVKDEAVSLERNNEGYSIGLRNHPAIQAGLTVLALGNFPNTGYSELKDFKGYFSYPWPAESILQNFPADKPVAIIGSGLSSIDAMHTCLEAGHKEKIYFVSRNGMLPKVRSILKSYDLKFVTMENIDRLLASGKQASLKLEQVVDLFMKEIEAAEGKAIDLSALSNPKGSHLEILEEDIAKAKKNSRPYQNALIATEPLIGYIWNMMSVDDRKRFDREYKSVWTAYRFPMPWTNAEKVCKVLRSGQLEILSGLKSITPASPSGGFNVETDTRNNGQKTVEVAAVINAIGQGNDVKKIDSDLIRSLLSNNIIDPHPNGGLNVDYATSRVVDTKGKVIDSLFNIGELTRGVHFFTSGISSCTLRAKEITDFILNKVNLPC